MGFHGHQQVQRHTKRNFIHSDSEMKRSDSSCLNGGFYTYPTSGLSVNSLNTLNITWDTTCLTPADNAVDIYLYAPAASSPRIHIWEDVDYSNGYYEATLMPRWWNSTASEQLQLLIIQSGDAPFMATLPAGPIFTATYSTPSTGTPAAAQTSLGSTDDGITLVGTSSSASTSSSHLSKGKIAASVIMPLLIVVSLLTAWWYIKRSRSKGKAERKKWTEKVDQRMSVVSADWASMSTKGAQAAIRNSMAVRASMSMDQQRMSSFDQQRMSTMDTTNLAGMGVVAPGGGVGGFFIPGQEDFNVNPIVSMPVPSFIPESTSPSTPPLRLNGTGVGLRSSVAPRGSRVISFAAEPAIPGRPSGETRRSIYDRERPSVDSRRSAYSQYSTSRGSRAFHYAGEEEEPPMPEGAAERASAFYMLGNNGIGSANDAMRHSHMNVSSTSLNSSANASRMSRFDEIYGVSEEDYSGNRSSGGDYSYSSPEFSMTSPDIGGPVPLSTSDIQKKIKNGSVSSSGGKPSFEEDVGPALSMMRAQEQEQEDDYFTQAKAQAQVHHLRQSTVSETIFAASPSPYETTFPAFPTPVVGGSVTMPTPSLNGAPIVSTTGSPLTYPATSAAGGAGVFGGMAPPKNAMSPDDMLRAYAERKAAAEAEASASGRASPSPSLSSSPVRSSSPSSFGRRASLKIAKITTPGLHLKSKVSKSKINIAKISNPSPLAREVVTDDVEEEGSAEAV